MIKTYVSVYVPGTKNIDQKLDDSTHQIIVNQIMVKLSNSFGGCTAQNATGGYIDTAGSLIIENITIVKSYTDNPDSLGIIRGIAIQLKSDLAQESVTIESNDGIEFI
jgi:hypothetical protein